MEHRVSLGMVYWENGKVGMIRIAPEEHNIDRKHTIIPLVCNEGWAIMSLQLIIIG
jgi:hypothetical protein